MCNPLHKCLFTTEEIILPLRQGVSVALIRITAIYYTQQSLSVNCLIMSCLTRIHSADTGVEFWLLVYLRVYLMESSAQMISKQKGWKKKSLVIGKNKKVTFCVQSALSHHSQSLLGVTNLPRAQRGKISTNHRPVSQTISWSLLYLPHSPSPWGRKNKEKKYWTAASSKLQGDTHTDTLTKRDSKTLTCSFLSKASMPKLWF